MKVIKRDGREEEWDSSKIENAVLQSFLSVDKEINNYAKTKAKAIAEMVYKSFMTEEASVEEIQDLVEENLMSCKRKDVAKAYILFRDKRRRARQNKSELFQIIKEKISASNVQNQNANVDEHSFGGRMGESNSAVMKQLALDEYLSLMARENHLNNEIYIHDLDHYAVGDHNCLSIPFDDLLAKGFNTRQTDIRPASSINTAFQLVAVIFQLQSLQQFGGVSATHLDWTMVPYVRKSFHKHWMTAWEYFPFSKNIKTPQATFIDIVNTPIDSEEYTKSEYDNFSQENLDAIYEYAMDMTKKELRQAVEGLFHNLNTLQSRSGNQLPFTSINYGTCTLPEGRMVIRALLEGSIDGVGKIHKTPIFPCSIFQCMKGVNRKEGEPNYDLFKLALKSTAKRLYPNYANVDWSGNAGYDRNDPRTYFSTMGKRNLAHVKSFEPRQRV